MFRLRPTNRPGRRSAGYTLVEVIVAMLVASIMVTAVFSVALSAKAGTGKSDRNLIATQAARQLTSLLRAYVTGCGCNPATGSCSDSGIPKDCTLLRGPNTTRVGAATWYLNSPAASPPIIDSRGDVYALAEGVHSVTGLLPGWFESAPYFARVDYAVTTLQTVEGRPVPEVDVTVHWTEP